jgi:hypothetical protein
MVPDTGEQQKAVTDAFTAGDDPEEVLAAGYAELLELGRAAFLAALTRLVAPDGTPALVRSAAREGPHRRQCLRRHGRAGAGLRIRGTRRDDGALPRPARRAVGRRGIVLHGEGADGAAVYQWRGPFVAEL